MKRAVKRADEYDATSWMRHYLAYLQRAGARSAIKRRLRRRERHVAKHHLNRED